MADCSSVIRTSSSPRLLPPHVPASVILLRLFFYCYPLSFSPPGVSFFFPHLLLSFGELLSYLFLSCGLERKQTGTEEKPAAVPLLTVASLNPPGFRMPRFPPSLTSLPPFHTVFLNASTLFCLTHCTFFSISTSISVFFFFFYSSVLTLSLSHHPPFVLPPH